MGKRKAPSKKATVSASAPALTTVSQVTRMMESELAALHIERPEDAARSATGVLTSHPLSHDVQISSFSLLFHGVQLIEDTTLTLNCMPCMHAWKWLLLRRY
jgi:hypothetical protein